MTKYLFCFPMGGINNMFEVINRCYKYCLKYNRILVIDSRFVYTFNADIHNFIYFKPAIIYKDDIDKLFTTIQTTSKTIYPDIFTNNRHNYKDIIQQFKFTTSGYIYKMPNNDIKNLTINLNVDYKEDVILYAKCIGGNGILDIFKICELKTDVKTEINNRLKKLPKPFVSLHLRNTDKKSDTLSFVANILPFLTNKHVFVATDNYQSLQHVLSLYDNTKVHTFSKLPTDLKLIGKPIHENNAKLNKEEFVIDCLADLIILCFGDSFFYSCKDSGFSKNVCLLRDNIKVVKSII